MGQILNTDAVFFFGTINGIQADDTANVLATYTSWQGNPTVIPSIYPQSGVDNEYFSIVIIYDSTSTPPTNVGTYANPFSDPPVVGQIIPVLSTDCQRNCYEAVFTVDDLSTDSLTGLTFNGQAYDYTHDFPMIDPDAAAADYLFWLVTDGVLEPSATVTITLNGLEVTMTICTVRTLTDGAWSDGVTQQGTFTFTQL